jgi:hypothetical protein
MHLVTLSHRDNKNGGMQVWGPAQAQNTERAVWIFDKIENMDQEAEEALLDKSALKHGTKWLMPALPASHSLV